MSWNPPQPPDDKQPASRDGRPYRSFPRPTSRWDAPHYDNVEDLFAPIPPRRRSPWALIIILLLASMFIWEAFRNPTLPDARFFLRVENDIAYAFGGTDAESFDDVRQQLDANPQIETIVLRHVPGTSHLAVNTRIAQLIRARGIDTKLEKRSFIASGGVDLFLAGEERSMECGARIGVHSWKDENGGTPKSLGEDPIEPSMIAFHESLGISPDFYAFTRDAADHEDLYYLTQSDIARYDLLDGGTCEKTGWLNW